MRDELVLLGKRSGSHGAGTWAPPGGHLEFGESIETCAQREVREETGLEIQNLRRGPYIDTLFTSENRHYITLFVLAESESGGAVVLEPDKCMGWSWHHWNDLPEPLFLPLEQLYKQGFFSVQVSSQSITPSSAS
jgi:8-oxo-dGTP diphosphatase